MPNGGSLLPDTTYLGRSAAIRRVRTLAVVLAVGLWLVLACLHPMLRYSIVLTPYHRWRQTLARRPWLNAHPAG